MINLGLWKSEAEGEGKEKSQSDWQKIAESIKLLANRSADEQCSLNEAYSEALRIISKKLISDLSSFQDKISYLVQIEVSLDQSNSIEVLGLLNSNLKTVFSVLVPPKTSKFKTVFSRLKSLTIEELKDELSDFFSDYFFSLSLKLKGYSSEIFTEAGFKKFSALHKLIEEKDTALITAESLLNFAKAFELEKQTFELTLGECSELLREPGSADRLLNFLIETRQLTKLKKFAAVPSLDAIQLLAKSAEGKDTKIMSNLDLKKHLVNREDVVTELSEEYLFEDELHTQPSIAKLSQTFQISGEALQILFDNCIPHHLQSSKEPESTVYKLSREQIHMIVDELTVQDEEQVLMVNPHNLLQMLRSCKSPPTSKSQQSILLQLWIRLQAQDPRFDVLKAGQGNDWTPESTALNNIPEFETRFDYKFSRQYLGLFEGFTELSLDHLLNNREELYPLMSKDVQRYIDHYYLNASRVDTEGFYLLVEKKEDSSGEFQPPQGEDCPLLNQFLQFIHVSDVELNSVLHQTGGKILSSESVLKSKAQAHRLVLQIKVLSKDHKEADFSRMDCVDVLNCLEFVSSLDSGKHLSKFVAQRILDSERYGPDLAYFLRDSNKSLALAMHRYRTYLEDMTTGSHKKVMLMMFAKDTDPQLASIIESKEADLTVEEIFEYLEKNHPYKLDALISNYYIEMEEGRDDDWEEKMAQLDEINGHSAISDQRMSEFTQTNIN
jgi:hypothetical protein